MTFKDLVFDKILSTPHGDLYQAIIRFRNGFGLSVLQGQGTLTSPDRPYEVAVISFDCDGTYKIVYPNFTQGDILSFLTADQVSEYMTKVSSETITTDFKS